MGIKPLLHFIKNVRLTSLILNSLGELMGDADF